MSVSLVASPMGARIGLSTASLGDQQVLVSVSPKAWRPTGSRQLEVELEDGHTQLCLYETERVLLHASNAKSQLMWNVLRGSRHDVQGSPSWDSSMLVPDVPPRGGTRLDALPSRNLAQETALLLRLFERVDLLGGDQPDLKGSVARSPLHQPLIYRRLLDEVARQLDSVRPAYRQVTEVRGNIRGRAVARSLARWQVGASTGIECTFSELTLSTPLLSCVCTALEWIADGRGVASVLPGQYADLRLRHDAVTLRRALSEVVAMSPSDALAVGRRLSVGRLDRAWAQSLKLSLDVVSQQEALASANWSRPVDALELSVPTDKLWERIVHEALRRAGFDAVFPQANRLTVDPWVTSAVVVSHTYPDNVARRSNDLFIVDAKYKTPASNKGPSRDDQYQMFAYSHLVRDSPREVRAAVLVYPGEAVKARWLRGRDMRQHPVELFSIQVPFPRPQEVATRLAWHAYLDAAGERVGRELELVERAVSTLTA